MRISVYLSLLLLMVLAAPVFAAPGARDRLLEQHQQVGRALDEGYYAAGKRIDIAAFDLAELQRQGHEIDPHVLAEVHEVDRALRRHFIEIDEARAAVIEQIAMLPPAGRYVLKIEVTAPLEADRPWFGIHSADLRLPSGENMSIPLTEFRNGALKRNYAYQVPPRDAVFIYGRPSSNHQMQAGFTPVAEAGEGDGTLALTALDAPRPGATPVRITLNGVEIFSGDNPFVDHDWHTHEFEVPAEAWAAAPPAKDDADRLGQRLDQLLGEIETFTASAAAAAERIDGLTRPLREGLVYEARPIEEDFWRHHFIRGMCNAQFDQDYEHQVKSFHHIGVNMLYSYAGRYSPLDELPQLLEQTAKVGMPVFLNPSMLKHTSREELLLGQPQALVEEVREYVRRVTPNTSVEVEVAADEPNFRDELGTLPAVREAFAAYLKTRQPLHESAGIGPLEVPESLPPAYGEGRQRALWMEWQLFRRDYFAEHFDAVWDHLEDAGLTLFTIIQQHQERLPQLAAYSSFARELPLISTDIYRDGGLIEAFGMQLLSNAGDSVAVFTAGSGYSSKSPERLARSMAIGMTHADGLLEWTDIYLAKYRDPRAFWGSAGDDRGRSMLGNWDPRYWDITAEMYGRMTEADAYLAADSAARVAVLVSERTLISDSHANPKPYYDRALSLYAHLVRQSVPIDAVLTESILDGHLNRYGLVILPDARVLAPEEEQAIRAWVRQGGTLVASGAVSANDPWGRPRSQLGLSDVLGVELTDPVSEPGQPTRVTPRPGAEVVAENIAGEPVLFRHAFGEGEVWYTADPRMVAAVRAGGSDEASTLREILTRLVKQEADTAAASLARPVDGLEFQLRTAHGATVVHLLNWIEGRTLDSVEIRVPGDGMAWTAFDPTRPGHPELPIKNGLVQVPAFSVHQMVVLKPSIPSKATSTDEANMGE